MQHELSPEELFVQANEAWDRGKEKLAFELFLRSAQAGNPSSQINLGYFYDEGIWIEKDKVEAMRWYKRAYRQGDGAAASNIAILYREKGNFRSAFAWFQRAAALKDGDALVEIGKLYLSGKGVRKNLVKTAESFEAALSSEFITEDSYEEAEKLLSEVRAKLVR